MSKSGTIRAGMGGWTFEPWDKSFYPDKLSKAKQLHYASRQVPTIEVNGTYYSTFKPPTFAKWAGEAPDGFVYSLKAIPLRDQPQGACGGRRIVERFLGSGVSELGEKLGPILWQFAPTKKFDTDDFDAFLKLLPEKQDGVKLRHAVEVRPTPSSCRNSSRCVARTTWQSSMPTTRNIRRFPMSPATSSMHGCRPVDDESRLATRQRRSTSGPDVRKSGPRAASLPIFREPTRRATHRSSRATCSSTSSPGKVRAPHGAMALMERVTG